MCYFDQREVEGGEGGGEGREEDQGAEDEDDACGYGGEGQ